MTLEAVWIALIGLAGVCAVLACWVYKIDRRGETMMRDLADVKIATQHMNRLVITMNDHLLNEGKR